MMSKSCGWEDPFTYVPPAVVPDVPQSHSKHPAVMTDAPEGHLLHGLHLRQAAGGGLVQGMPACGRRAAHQCQILVTGPQ